jgi:hypothetical protein
MDPKFRIYFEGLPDDAIRSAEKVVTSLNKANDAQKRYSRERQQLARTERQERFRELSQEEQYQRLLQRREQLERRLAQARARGQGSRVDALELLAARNRSALRGYAPPVLSPAGGGGGLGGIAGMLLGQLAGRAGGGMLGGLIGSLGGPLGVAAGVGGGLMLGDLAKRIAGAMVNAARGALEFADQIDDLAEQTGLTKIEVLRLRNAAASAGIGSQKAFGAISALGAARSAALGGDANSLALFSRFGVGPGMLAGGASSLDIGAQIAKSLGSGGISATDQGPLRSLLGRRPEQAFAALRAYVALNQGAASDTDAALERLANIQTKIEAAQNAFQIFRAKAVSDVIAFWEANSAAIAEVAKGIARVTGASGLVGLGAAAVASNPITRWLATQGLIRGASAASESGLLGGGVTPAANRTADPAPFVAPGSAGFTAPSAGVNFGQLAAASALGRIGLFRGAQDPDRVQIFRDQLKELVRIRETQSATLESFEKNLGA